MVAGIKLPRWITVIGAVLWANTAAAQQCTIAAKPPNAKTYSVQTFTYEVADNQPQLLDLYLPKNTTNPPLIVLIHGGGWFKGSRTDPKAIAAYFTSYGYAAASLDYRLATNGTNLFPAAVQDVRCGVRWLRSNAAQLGYNANNIGVWGGSAGGNLAGMLGAAGYNDPLLDGPDCPIGLDVPVNVQVVADYYGLNDGTDPSAFNKGQIRNFGAYLGVKNPLQDPALAIEAAADGYVAASPVLPLFIIVHGTADVTMPIQQSIDLANALTSVNATYEFFEVSGFGHGFSPFGVATSQTVVPSTCAMLAAFQQYLQ